MVITRICSNDCEACSFMFSVDLMPFVTCQSSEECSTLYLYSQGSQIFRGVLHLVSI